MDVQELWARACELLRNETNAYIYDYISKNLFPVRLEQDVLVLRIPMEPMKVMVNNRYAAVISTCLSEVAGHTITARILTQEELDSEHAAAPASVRDPSMQLNPKYTFDSFVVGSSNRFAHAAALAVAETPAEAYNPLFIYGGSGLGKTHLMHAIGNYIQQQYRDKRLLYITSETFTNELITAIQQNRNIEFRSRFRNVDILMVDDIQFIAGRDSTQEEFFHTFNALYEARKQIILTSDKPPQDIARLEERLRGRFAWGLTADIAKPDIETRIAILRKKANQEHIAIPDEVMEQIAANVDSNIRELEGCFNRLVAYAKLVNQPITMDLAMLALKDILEKKAHRVITPEIIMQTVCDFYNLKMEELTGSSRRREITVPRQIAMYLVREMTELSLPQIGNCFGGKDHTTVLHSCNQVTNNMKNSADLNRQVNDIRQLVVEG